MIDKIQEAYTEYQSDKMVDPATRYTHDDQEIFRAGWVAAQKKNFSQVRQSVWVTAPVAPDDDPE